MGEHVVTRVNDCYVCDGRGAAGSEWWANLHPYPRSNGPNQGAEPGVSGTAEAAAYSSPSTPRVGRALSID